jgi:hypothetical protein
MRLKYLAYTLSGLILAWSQARCEEPEAPPAPMLAPPVWPAAAAQPGPTMPNAFTEAPPPPSGAFEDPCEPGGGGKFCIPHMIGDFFGQRTGRLVPVPVVETTVVPNVQTITTTDTSGNIITQFIVSPPTVTTTALPSVRVVQAFDPVVARGDFKIGENESPRPQDRVFINYNYFQGVQGTEAFSPATTTAGPGGIFTTTLPDGQIVTTSDTITQGLLLPANRVNVHRETVGFEKTLFDGNASIGLRAPIVEQDRDDGISATDFGDLSVIFKYALINGVESGNVLSVGLAVTAPTGPALVSFDGNIDSFLIQPYIGYIYNTGGFYIQGFNSGVIPTDSRDVAVLFTDVALGMIAYHTDGNRWLSSVTPTVEVHVTTPLNHKGQFDLVTVPDSVDVTAGVHLGFGCHCLLTLGVTAPISGQDQFDVGGIAQFNYLF